MLLCRFAEVTPCREEFSATANVHHLCSSVTLTDTRAGGREGGDEMRVHCEWKTVVCGRSGVIF